MNQETQLENKLEAMLKLYHTNKLSPNQCGSRQVQTMDAPLPLVWSMIRDFHNPQAYKGFVKTCKVRHGDGGIGSVRDIRIMSGLPAETSTERLDLLDDEFHVMVFSIIGGDHGLVNYRSTVTVHEEDDKNGNCGKTVVIESYAVDVPEWSSAEDTCLFVNTIIGFNLKNLAKASEKLVSTWLRCNLGVGAQFLSFP